MKGKTIITIMIAGIITISPFLTGNGEAETLDNIQEKQSKVQERKGEAEEQLQEIDEETTKLLGEIEELDKSMMETQGSIRQKELEIEQQWEELTKLSKEIQNLHEQIDQRTEILKDRVIAQQQNGDSNPYLEIILNSQDLSDFISRLSAISEIMNSDRAILEQQEEDLLLVEKKEQEELEKQAEYELQLLELKDLEDALSKKSEEKDEALKKLESQMESVLEELLVLEKEEEFLQEQEAAIKKAAEEAVRRAAEKAKEDAQLAQNYLSDDVVENMPVITEDLFMVPALGPVTSESGRRILNGEADVHIGIDIGKRGANVPVVAAADGVVIRSYYSSSYGNVVFITHNLDGDIYTTVYAHLESRSVESGDIVDKGQIIGLMGNTGFSFGAHLHFELHEGEWNIGKSNAVDPRLYIDFDGVTEETE